MNHFVNWQKVCGVFFVLLCFFVKNTHAQCPVNIDFEQGTFSNWQCYKGSVSVGAGNTNSITVNLSAPTSSIHTIIPKSTKLDQYGLFPISPPDGSTNAVKLGNDGTGSQAERITYTFTVPPDQPNFSLTYQYAVVLQDPGHNAWQQPRFTAKVFDVAANAYITCSSFDYVATANIPGFKKSTVLANVIYKEWTPVNINLNGLQGKQIRLEFTTADCTESGHFGYAYIDINKTCSALISGNDYCSSATNLTLTGPAGFDKYKWYNADRTQIIGTTNPLLLNTIPPEGTKIILDVIPFTGFGCPNTIITTLNKHEIGLTINNPVAVCAPSKVNITNQSVISLTDSTALLSYWQDAACTISIPDPKNIATSGTYFIKATNVFGCADIKPVIVTVNLPPAIVITNPLTVCPGTPVNITDPNIVAGSSTGVTYSYWADANATTPLQTPASIITAGTYYIKATFPTGCNAIAPVKVSYFAPFVFNISDPAPVCSPATINLKAPVVTTGSGSNLTFTYYIDAAATIPLALPDAVNKSGVYYIKAISITGCSQIAPVTVTINPSPQLSINTPTQVCFPEKINITEATVTKNSTNVDKLSYWKDANATIPLLNPQAVADSGTYYIKATSILGCETIQPVAVIIHQLPVVVITNPAKVYLPTTLDLTQSEITARSTPKLTFTYYNDAACTDKIKNPAVLNKGGTYYVKGTNVYGCYDIKPVVAVIADLPKMIVPKAFTPTLTENNRLYVFTVGVKTFISFKILNRWGILLFQTNSTDPLKGWDGYYKGQLQSMDTYTWYAEGYDYVGRFVHESGNTMLIK